MVLITVTDQGRGFSTEHITKVGAYMQFDRKMQEQQGLGLGLTIAKRLTEFHGGTLTIQSQRGVSTEMTIKLPAHDVGLDRLLRPDCSGMFCSQHSPHADFRQKMQSRTKTRIAPRTGVKSRLANPQTAAS